MISVPLIDWQPIAVMPEDRKDGRQVMLAFLYENETINPGPPYWLYATGRWHRDRWIDVGNQKNAVGGGTPDSWADINPPE